MNVDQFIEHYEKRSNRLENYRKICIVLSSIVVIVLLLSNAFLNLQIRWSIYLLIFFCLVCGTLINIERQKNANTIPEKWMDDLDTDFALEVYRKLLREKKEMTYVMPLYLNLLCLTRNYEELEENYAIYMKEKNKVIKPILDVLLEHFASLMADKTLYEKLIFQHKFSKFYGVEGELNKSKARLRFRDEQKKILQMFFQKRFEQVIDEVERMHAQNRFQHLWGEVVKQQCLYYLNRRNEIYLHDAPEWMLHPLQHLMDTGEEYYYADAGKWVEQIEGDMPRANKGNRKTFFRLIVCIALISWSVNYLSADDVEKFITEERYEEKLRENGVFANEVLCFVNDEDYTVALIHGISIEQPSEEQYYFAAFDYSRKWLIEQEELKLYPLGHKLELDQYYVYEDQKENYVVFLSEEEMLVFYNGEQMWNHYEERIVDGKQILVNDFKVQEEFDKNLVRTLLNEKVFKEETYEIGNNHYDENDGSMYSFYDTFEGWELRAIDSASGSRWYKLDHTTDGGKTWETINEDPFAGEYGWVEGIAFYWGKVGYISISKYAGEYARVFLTEDGGYTFEEIVLPVEECEEMNPEEYQYYSMPEVNDEEIRITVRESRYHMEDGYVFRSEDRGKTWEYAGKEVDEFYYDKEE